MSTDCPSNSHLGSGDRSIVHDRKNWFESASETSEEENIFQI